MNTVVRKIGNSEGVILPKDVLERLGVSAGDQLEIVASDDSFGSSNRRRTSPSRCARHGRA